MFYVIKCLEIFLTDPTATKYSIDLFRYRATFVLFLSKRGWFTMIEISFRIFLKSLKLVSDEESKSLYISIHISCKYKIVPERRKEKNN